MSSEDETGISPPVKYFTDRSKVVLLLWIICVISSPERKAHGRAKVYQSLRLSRFRVCSLLACGHLLGKGWPWLSFVMSNCEVVTFPCGILGQVLYLIVSIPDLCHLSYYVHFNPLSRGNTS